MNLSQLIATIESFEFDSRFSVLSGFSTVLNGFEFDETVQALIALLQNNPDNQLAILERLKALIPDYQKDYMHTHDIPICAYLYALYQVSSLGVLEVVISQIIEKKEFFWARKMATKILQEQVDIIYSGFINFVLQEQIHITRNSSDNLLVTA